VAKPTCALYSERSTGKLATISDAFLIHDQADRDAVSSQLLRYRDGHGDDWADIIDFLTMYRRLGDGLPACSPRSSLRPSRATAIGRGVRLPHQARRKTQGSSKRRASASTECSSISTNTIRSTGPAITPSPSMVLRPPRCHGASSTSTFCQSAT
jgi:hypothetical protein